jgi:protein-disulfide isomerase
MGQSDLAPGSEFAGDFRIERPLGSGGMGAVYVAHQLSTSRKRALKVMHGALGREDDMRRRFVQEATVGSRIESDHLVEVIAAGVDADSGVPWIAMELLDGEDLDSRVRRSGPLSVSEVMAILSELCHALAAAHAVGVVHRDLKPENVFLAKTKREGAETTVKLLDLGIAKLVAENVPSDTAAIGTPLWMAPEQTGGRVGPATDVWALGLLAFFMLTGRSYWIVGNAPTGENALMSALREVVVEPLEPASERARRLKCGALIPAGFDQWFSRCVDRDASRRFPDASVAKRELAKLALGSAETVEIQQAVASAVTSGRSPPARTTAPSPRPRRRRSTAIALAAIVPAALAVIWLLRSAGEMNRRMRVAASASASVPPAVVEGQDAAAAEPRVDQDDSTTVWRIPIGDSPTRGPRAAPVTIVELGNFQCPYSKALESKLRALIDEFPGKVRLVWKDDPLAIHSLAENASQVARQARAEQGEAGFWAAHDAMLEPGFKPDRESLLATAKKLGVDQKNTAKAIDERRYLEQISRDAELADDIVAVGTPSFFVNGRRVQPTNDLDKVRAVVKEEIDHAAKLVASGTPPASVYDAITSSGHGGMPLDVRMLRFRSFAAPGRGHGSVMLAEVCNYTHFMCRLAQPTLDKLFAAHPDQLALVWLDLPQKDDEVSRNASVIALTTYRQKGEDAWVRYRDALFSAQKKPGGVSAAIVRRSAFGVGFTAKEFENGLEDPGSVSSLSQNIAAASSAKVTEPATFLICSTPACSSGAYFLSSAQPTRALERRVRLALAAKGGPLPLHE